MYQSSSRPTSTTRVVEMMPLWRWWGWSVRHQKRTVHIIFYRGDVGAMLPSKICYNQSINIFIANSQLSIIIYYTAKNRAPKFYAGLLQILCWEPDGLPSFTVSGDPWDWNDIWHLGSAIKSEICEEKNKIKTNWDDQCNNSDDQIIKTSVDE